MGEFRYYTTEDLMVNILGRIATALEAIASGAVYDSGNPRPSIQEELHFIGEHLGGIKECIDMEEKR